MSLEETLQQVADTGTVPLGTLTYAESIAAKVPVPGTDEPTAADVVEARKSLQSRGLLSPEGSPQGGLLTFASMFSRPGARTWFWESSTGTALIVIATGRDAAAVAAPSHDERGTRFSLSVGRLGTVVEDVTTDAWTTDVTSLAAADLGGALAVIRLEHDGAGAAVTAPRQPEAPIGPRGLRRATPMATRPVDRTGFAHLLAAAFANVTWGLDEDGRALYRSLQRRGH